jgi:hypothetical protein
MAEKCSKSWLKTTCLKISEQSMPAVPTRAAHPLSDISVSISGVALALPAFHAKKAVQGTFTRAAKIMRSSRGTTPWRISWTKGHSIQFAVMAGPERINTATECEQDGCCKPAE